MRSSLLLLLALAACQTDPAPSSSGSAPAGTPAVTDPADLPDPSMIEDVSVASTLDLLRNDPLAASPSLAIQTLDLWITRLDTVSAEGASEVRSDLRELRNQLQSSPLDGRGIGLTLKDLAESTAPLAQTDADLGRLAGLLRATGQALAPDTSQSAGRPASVQ